MIKIIPYLCYNTESLDLNTEYVSAPLIFSLGCSEHQIYTSLPESVAASQMQVI